MEIFYIVSITAGLDLIYKDGECSLIVMISKSAIGVADFGLLKKCRLTQRLKNDLTLSVYVSFPIL